MTDGGWGGPIVPRHVADDVQDRLVTAIALGVYVPGQQLPTERELAAMLGVSRTSVRGALQQLTDTGYLEVRRGRNGGYFVLADWGPGSAEHVSRQLVPNWAEFEALFDARTLIEPLIARTAAERCTADDAHRDQRGPRGLPRGPRPRRLAAGRLRPAPRDRLRHQEPASWSRPRSTCGPGSASTSVPSPTPRRCAAKRSSSTASWSRR